MRCRRTQQGNNNAYCQDNEISWLDWDRLERNRALVEFTRRLIAFRKAHPVFRRKSFFTGLDHDSDGRADIEWFESSGQSVRWNTSRPVLAAYLNGTRGGDRQPRGGYGFLPDVQLRPGQPPFCPAPAVERRKMGTGAGYGAGGR